MNEDKEADLIIDRLRHTKAELDQYNKVMAAISDIDISKMSDDEVIALSVQLFGDKESK
jgi:hypothetical protein